jgi:thiamine kinase-like enzyme
MADVLGPQERTLSPSDFGFHNAIKRPNGQIVFIDFEYFGWDDPAKMISDYLLHPAQDLNEDLRQRFFDGCIDSFADWPGVSSRMDLVYPLCGLKWCLLLLNEFLPRYIETREHAHGANLDVANLQSEQLAKSRRMLARVKAGHEPPY